MSRELINHSSDLKKLQDEGYEVRVVAGHLVVDHVPYVTHDRKVKYGALVSTLMLAGERTTTPDTHVVFFSGDHPCNKDGAEIQQLRHNEGKKKIGDMEVDRSFSNKPANGYQNYYDKMSTYVNIISSPAQALDPAATARTYVVPETEGSSVFKYTDTATARAGIGEVSKKLDGLKIAIVGLGGTGSYVLDLVAKTPVAEIHLFDVDHFHQHNAFRAPGAASQQQLEALQTKVRYFVEMYSHMRRGVIAHEYNLDRENAAELASMDFVFLCLDSGQARKELIGALNEYGRSFVDVGMGVTQLEEVSSLLATVRVSTSTPEYRDAQHHIPVCDSDPDPAYNSNVQIGDLNCLNATLAVLRWKKLCGFYQDLEREHFSAYSTNVNQLVNGERRK